MAYLMILLVAIVGWVYLVLHELTAAVTAAFDVLGLLDTFYTMHGLLPLMLVWDIFIVSFFACHYRQSH